MNKSPVISFITFAVISSCMMGQSFASREKTPVNDLNNHAASLLKDGFYLGVSGGYDNYTMRSNINNNSNIPTNIFPSDPTIGPVPLMPFSFNQKSAVNTGSAGAFAGFGKYFQNHPKLYLGAEFFANWVEAQSKSATILSSSIKSTGTDSFQGGTYFVNQGLKRDIQVHNNLGISLLPGMKLSERMLGFLRFGYALSSVHVGQSLNSRAFFQNNSIFNTTPLTLSETSSTDSHTVGGFAYGLGFESVIHSNWSVRAEYTHTDFSHFNSGGMRISLDDDRVAFGLIYHI